MTRPARLIVLAALTTAGGCASTPEPARSYLSAFEVSERAATPFKPITDFSPQATLDEGYAIQRTLVARRVARRDRVAGYKGGLMSDASLMARGVSEPLVGVLFRSGRIAAGGDVSLCPYRKASFELKLGFVFARPVRTSRNAPDFDQAVAEAVGQVVPVIDLPDIGYRNPDKYSAVDMVASNVSASRYVVGRPAARSPLDLDELAVTLSRDDVRLSSGKGRESFGNQWRSLSRVIRQIDASGRKVKAGDIVLTGKIGDRGWLPAGRYLADYGPLGSVPFTVAACK